MFEYLLLIITAGAAGEAMWHHQWLRSLYWVGAVLINSSILMMEKK